MVTPKLGYWMRHASRNHGSTTMSSPTSSAWRSGVAQVALDGAQEGIRAAQLFRVHEAGDACRLEQDHGPLRLEVVERRPLALALRHDGVVRVLPHPPGQVPQDLPVTVRNDWRHGYPLPSLRSTYRTYS